MNYVDKIKIEALEEVVKKTEGMWPESVLPTIEEMIEDLKNNT